MVLKCDLLFLFQNKGHFNQLAGSSYCTQDISFYTQTAVGARNAAVGFSKDVSQGMKIFEEKSQTELSPFIFSYV